MTEFNAFQQTFEHRPGRFLRWSLSPVLLTCAVLFSFESVTCQEKGNTAGLAIGLALVVACIAGLLALWGVRHAGRIVTGLIGSGYAAYIYHQCFVEFDGDWGWGASRAETTPINSILGFLVFGVPCLIYTIFGRFTIRRPKAEPRLESLLLSFVLDDERHGSFELRNRFRDLADAISDKVCDGMNADYGGESEDENGKASHEFWAIDVEEFVRGIRAAFPEEPLLANCTWTRWDAEGTKTVLENPFKAPDQSS